MKVEKEFKLVQAARKKGGDKYETAEGWSIYVEQSVSRPSGRSEPLDKLKITFEAV